MRKTTVLAPNILLQNRYLIVRPVGQGGMGTVYEAKDTRLNATVALKETRLNDAASLRAFEREAQLLARIRHPVLPKVIDHFTESAGQFLVMEFIAGDDLATLMEKRGGRFPPSAVIPWVFRWGDQLLDALHHLHSMRPPVYHRDIKPQNLKLSERGDIILLDFGLAKQGDPTVGGDKVSGFTPNYAPLEQIRGSAPDPRSDLYSLAATLYHLATGVKPADALSRIAALLNDQQDPLTPPYEHNQFMPPAMNELLVRALSPNVDERPHTAAEMRRLLQLAGSTPTVVLQTAPPRPGVPLLAPNDDDTQTRRGVTRPPASPAPGTVFGPPPDIPVATVRLGGNEQAEEAAPGTLLQTLQTGSPVISVALSPDGRIVAVGGDDASLSLWDLHEADMLGAVLEHHSGSIASLLFTPDGERVLSASDDKTVCLWKVENGDLVHQTHEFSDPIESMALSPDGQLLAIGGWGQVVFLCQLLSDSILSLTEIYSTFVHCLTFSPDSNTLVAGCYDSVVRMWDVQTRRPLRELHGHTSFVLSVAFSPDGKLLASASSGGQLFLWRMSDGRQIDALRGHSGFVRSLAFSPDGRLLASASEDQTVRLWRADDGELLYTLEGHGGGVTSLVFSPDSKLLVTGSRDTKIRLWQVG